MYTWSNKRRIARYSDADTFGNSGHDARKARLDRFYLMENVILNANRMSILAGTFSSYHALVVLTFLDYGLQESEYFCIPQSILLDVAFKKDVV
jgi:hypothetical protein